jgi:hypothetical protein
MALLLNPPECLAKLHAEMDQVIGTDRPIAVSDKISFPNLNIEFHKDLSACSRPNEL